MANPVSITSRPQYLNANTLVYNFWDLRRYTDGSPPGPGVGDYESWRVMQRQAGATMDVDVGKTAVGLMQAWVRGSTRGGQGLYRIDNIDPAAPTTDTYLPQFAVTVPANSSGNPRLDQVVLEIQDLQHAGASTGAQIRVVTGTPTAGATLDNRNGAAALPPSSIPLADIIVVNGATAINTADIRDRRAYPLRGTFPSPLGANLMNQVTFEARGPIATTLSGNSLVAQSTNLDNTQAAVLMSLPRRIVNAIGLRWKYTQNNTPNTGQYNIGIYDASGRLIVSTGAIAFAGAANAVSASFNAIAPTTFEAGYYYVAIGVGAATAASGCHALLSAGGSIGGASTFNEVYRSLTGGTTLPTTLGGMTDTFGGVTSTAPQLQAVPIVALVSN